MSTVLAEMKKMKDRTAWKKRLLDFGRRQQQIDADLQSWIGRFSDTSDITAVDAYACDLDSDLQKENENVIESIKELKLKVRNLKSKLTNDSQRKPGFNASALREVVNDVRESISSLFVKELNVATELASAEEMHSKQIQALDKTFQSWTRYLPSDKRPKSVRSITTVFNSHNLLWEVQQFQDFLNKTGGHYEGWEEYEHREFVKLLDSAQSEEDFEQNCLLNLPQKSLENIRSHVKWWDEYTVKKELSRQAIQRWKNSKEATKLSLVAKSKEVEELVKIGELDFEAQKKKEAEKREKQLQLLSQWKAEKTRQRELEEQRVLKQAKHQLKKKKQEQQRQFEMKLSIAEYKASKRFVEAEEREEKRIAEEKERERVREANKRVVEMWDKNKEQILQKRKKILEVTASHSKDSLPKTKGVKAKRNPDRLLQPTKSWQERVKSNEETKKLPSDLKKQPRPKNPANWRAQKGAGDHSKWQPKRTQSRES